TPPRFNRFGPEQMRPNLLPPSADENVRLHALIQERKTKTKTRRNESRFYLHGPTKSVHRRPARLGLNTFAQRPDSIVDPGHLPDHQGQVCTRLRADRRYHLNLPDRWIAIAAAGRTLHRSAPDAVCDRHWDDLQPGWTIEPRLLNKLRGD